MFELSLHILEGVDDIACGSLSSETNASFFFFSLSLCMQNVHNVV